MIFEGGPGIPGSGMGPGAAAGAPSGAASAEQIATLQARANLRLPTALLVHDAQEWYAALDDGDVDWLYIRCVPTAAQVADAHRAGKRVFKAGPLANGIEPDAWRGLRDAGVDAILSDYPLECRRALME